MIAKAVWKDSVSSYKQLTIEAENTKQNKTFPSTNRLVAPRLILKTAKRTATVA
jgi:hypothetical protein